MREKTIIVFDIFLTVLIIILFNRFLDVLSTNQKQDDQMKILEQQLVEQIQEKEVYMKMLELKGEE